MARGGFQINIGLDRDQFVAAQRALAHIKDGARKAGSAALNRAAEGTRTVAKRIVARDYTIRASDAAAGFAIVWSKPETLSARVNVRGASLPMTKFRVTPTTARRPGPRGGVRVELRRGGARSIQEAFIARVHAGGALGVAHRAGQARYPVRTIWGPSVPGMLRSHYDELEANVCERLRVALMHEIKRVAAGIGKR